MVEIDNRIVRAVAGILAMIAFSAFYQTAFALGATDQTIAALGGFALVCILGARYLWTGEL